jgi:hypothetical protein
LRDLLGLADHGAPVVDQRRLEIVALDPKRAEFVAENNYLASHARVVTSQDGEDGVIAEIMRRLGITAGWCVEFGAYDGKSDSNTWDLVHNRGWKAVYIEPSPAFSTLAKNCEGLSDVYCFQDPVAASGDNSLDSILSRTPLPRDFDLLVIDIDGDDYYVWEGFTNYRPKVVMIEFNPFIPADIHYVKPAAKVISASASLSAVCALAKSKGYQLVCVVGGNAVFVLAEQYALFSIGDNTPAAMFQSRMETKIFQGYDGTLHLAGNREFIWKHQIDASGKLRPVMIADEDVQVLPGGLRVFRPRLSYENSLLEEQAGQLDAARVPLNRLLSFRRNVTSECGEDGILERIFAMLTITKGYCVEVGAFDGVAFSNTRSLIHNGGWSALLLEQDPQAGAALTALYKERPSVETMCMKVEATGTAGLDAVFARSRVPREFDFLCIDIEGNDFHLWSSLRRYRPKVVMVGFNPSVPNDVLFAQENSLDVHDGASLLAFIDLARTKGYELASVTDWNAVFVRADLFGAVGIADNHISGMYYPVFEMKIFQSADSYVSTTGCNRLVWHNYVFDPEQIQPLPPNVRAMPFTTGRLGELRSTFF